MRTLRLLPLLLLLLPALRPARLAAQTADGTFTLSVNAQVVTVPVTVRDAKGNLVKDLTKDDFTLAEDGKPQRIRYLSVDHDRALTMALLIDTSGSQKDYIKKERAASRTFLDTMLTRPDDTALIVRFDNALALLAKPTSSKADLQAALEHLEDPHEPRLNPPGGTLFYDALELTCKRVLHDVDGRKAMVVLTDGRDDGSVATLESAIDAAQRSDTVVYSILYTDNADSFISHGASDPQRGKNILASLSDATGGHLFEVSRRHPLEKIFEDIAEEMRTQYVLAYTPPKGLGAGFRTIEVKGRDKTWKIQTRAGYFYNGTDDDE